MFLGWVMKKGACGVMGSRMKQGSKLGNTRGKNVEGEKALSGSLLSAFREQQRGQWGCSAGDEAREVMRNQITRRPAATENKEVA